MSSQRTTTNASSVRTTIRTSTQLTPQITTYKPTLKKSSSLTIRATEKTTSVNSKSSTLLKSTRVLPSSTGVRTEPSKIQYSSVSWKPILSTLNQLSSAATQIRIFSRATTAKMSSATFSVEPNAYTGTQFPDTDNGVVTFYTHSSEKTSVHSSDVSSPIPPQTTNFSYQGGTTLQGTLSTNINVTQSNSAVTLDKQTSIIIGTTVGSGGVVLMVLIVIIIVIKRVNWKQRVLEHTPDSGTELEMENGHITSRSSSALSSNGTSQQKVIDG